MSYDRALPVDPIEGTVVEESGDYKVIEIKGRYLCYEGDREVRDCTFEWRALDWLNQVTSEYTDTF